MMTTPAGWYDDGTGAQRWWDGQQWTQHAAPTQPSPPPPAASMDLRRAHLASWIADASRKGWRVESQSDTTAVLVQGGTPNHVLHLILTLVTVGLWAIVWIIIAATTHEKRMTVFVDEHGVVRQA